MNAAAATATLARATLPDLDAADSADLGAPGSVPPSPDGPRYRLTRELGRGGLGEVFVADDRDIGRQVAIKRVRLDRRSADAVQRFVQEVRTTGQLDHPNIVPLHDVSRDDDGGFYAVMKYLDGESLESLIARLRAGDREAHGAWDFEQRVALFRQIAQAIRFAHGRGVVHRDIKPANVMVGACGAVHVVDWGLAKSLRVQAPAGGAGGTGDGRTSHETRQGALVGTPLYMAPEQVRREPADERTDIWQLCLLLYELLTLEHYLDGEEDVGRILDSVLDRPIRHPRSVRSPHQPRVPVELGHLVMRGLRRDRADRWGSVGEILHALDRRAAGDIDVSCPLTMQKWLLHRSLRFVDQHPGLGSVAILGIVSAAGAALFGSFGLALLGALALAG